MKRVFYGLHNSLLCSFIASSFFIISQGPRKDFWYLYFAAAQKVNEINSVTVCKT